MIGSMIFCLVLYSIDLTGKAARITNNPVNLSNDQHIPLIEHQYYLSKRKIGLPSCTSTSENLITLHGKTSTYSL